MDKRYLDNPFPDYQPGTPVELDKEHIKNLICSYVDAILENTSPGSPDQDQRGDLYVGNAGIAYMFWKLFGASQVSDLYPALDYARTYINHAKANAKHYKKRSDERIAFLCGNAGIYAVSAAISSISGQDDVLADDLSNFLAGIETCKTVAFSKHGCDEVLVGRAGFLSGCYWLNDVIDSKPIKHMTILDIVDTMIESGRKYAEATNSPLPLMYQYHGTEYLGAAHGLCAILHMMLDSPYFGEKNRTQREISKTKLQDIKTSVDFYLNLQDSHGNFPVALEDLRSGREKRLVHWCHGAPGSVYLLAKAYLVFKDKKYLDAAIKAGDLVWKEGLLRKGPGICHGIAGNGYVFLLLYRLTEDPKHLYRASKFMEYLTNQEFKQRARIPDRPYSLYEGVAGTVCYLIDLLEPKKAHFPFMEVFH